LSEMRRFSADYVAARPSPDSIRTGDVYVTGEDGYEHRFEGTDEEFVEKYWEYTNKYPLNDVSLWRPFVPRFQHDMFKRKPSLAVLHMYNADNTLQRINIEVNKAASKEDLSKTDQLASATNYNNGRGENCQDALLHLYFEPTRPKLRALERCIGETYCSEQRSALKEQLAKTLDDPELNKEYNEKLNVYSNCVAKRPEFVHAHKVAEKLYCDDEGFKGNFA